MRNRASPFIPILVDIWRSKIMKFDINKALSKINELTDSSNGNNNSSEEDQDRLWKEEVLKRLERIERKLDQK